MMHSGRQLKWYLSRLFSKGVGGRARVFGPGSQVQFLSCPHMIVLEGIVSGLYF